MGRPKIREVGSTKRIQVTFTREQYELLKQSKGEFGPSDSEVVRNIVLA